jgi:hypothetical protein
MGNYTLIEGNNNYQIVHYSGKVVYTTRNYQAALERLMELDSLLDNYDEIEEDEE